MEKADVYRITDTLDDASLEVMAARLETRGKHPRFMTMLEEYLNAMRIDGARNVLDLGCGTGVASRAVLRRPRFAGAVTGAHVLADIGRADFFSATIPSFVKLLPRAGAMSEAQAAAWAEAMLARSAQGIFFGASNFYSYVARA
jgi:hypothetical protein